MNRGILESSHVQQMIGRNPSLWSMNELSLPIQETSLILPPFSSSYSSSSSSSSSLYLQSSQPSIFLPTIPWPDSHELPVSWSQLLLGGLMEEEERCSLSTPFQSKRVENWENHVIHPSATTNHMIDVKQENEETPTARSPWSQDLSANSSTRSCVTASSSSNLMDLSNSKAERKHLQSSECDSTPGSGFKKARVQSSSAQSHMKVRKEKLGDRISALHQLVSPFGKTDTASVLSEAIGYIRFLQGQIEVLSLPYLGNSSTHTVLPEVSDELKKDLRSRGLCLVPVSSTMNVAGDNGADYWTPNFGEGFQ